MIHQKRHHCSLFPVNFYTDGVQEETVSFGGSPVGNLGMTKIQSSHSGPFPLLEVVPDRVGGDVGGK